MQRDIVFLVIGLVGGFVTAWFFERRARKDARALSERHSRLSLDVKELTKGFGVESRTGSGSRAHPDLATAVRARARATQDASGRVPRQELISFFVQHGSDRESVERELRTLMDQEVLTEDGTWLRIQ